MLRGGWFVDEVEEVPPSKDRLEKLKAALLAGAKKGKEGKVDLNEEESMLLTHLEDTQPYEPPAFLVDKEGKPPAFMKGGLIHVMECPFLKSLLREEIIHIEENPKGVWEIYARPADWTNPFLYGFDTRNLPFRIGDYDVVKAFVAKGFAVRDAKTKRPLIVSNRDADLMGGIQDKGKGRLMTTTDFEEPKS